MSYILKRAIKADKKSANKSPASKPRRKGPKGIGSQKTKSYNRKKKGPMKK